MDYDVFFSYLENSEKRILSFLENNDMKKLLNPTDLYESVNFYIGRQAKRLRPSVLLMACGSLGGDEREKIAIPAAAGIELFHTWTLVHDDIIDNDHLRRGEPTVHEIMTAHAKENYGFNSVLAKEYGRDLAILAGDIQHAWSIVSFVDCAILMSANPILVLKLVRHLQSYVIANLISGEVLDIQYGMKNTGEIIDVDEDKIIKMLWLKTGVLYEFAGLAGALIGKNTTNFDDPQVKAIKNFTSNCGTAFQLQDDILGIVGNEDTLGKPVGSDIREGKKTVIVYESLKNANALEKRKILSTLGNKEANPDDILEVIELFGKLGGIKRSNELAASYIEKAVSFLDIIEDSKYKELLILWADFMTNRGF